jgi:ParB family transcriptional regulator, chromosome partitioning protein
MDLELQQLDRRYEALRMRNPSRERRLLASLSEHGQQVPIVVVRASEPDHYVVVDGFKRLRALVRLRHDAVLGTCWEMSEADALITDRLLCDSAGDSALEQGWLLRDLTDHFALRPEDLARRFDRSVSWVSRRLGLVRDLPEAVQERVRGGQVVAHAAMKYLLPLARANVTDCLRLLEGLGAHKPSSRAVGRLYAAYMSADARTRARLLSDPLLFLRVEEESRRPPTDPTDQLVADLRGLIGLAGRARRRLDGTLSDARVDEVREEVDVLLTRARTALERLCRLWRKEVRNARRTDAAGNPQAAAGGARHPHDCAGAADLARCGAGGTQPGHGRAATDPARVTG